MYPQIHFYHYIFSKQIISVVCDQSATNMRAIKLMGATLNVKDTTRNAHCVSVDGCQIPVLFDVPHLVKSVRNNVAAHGLKVS